MVFLPFSIRSCGKWLNIIGFDCRLTIYPRTGLYYSFLLIYGRIRKMKKIEPIVSMCPPFGACPAVYDSADGYLVVGVEVDASKYAGLSNRIAPNEKVVCIPKELLEKIRKGDIYGIHDS